LEVEEENRINILDLTFNKSQNSIQTSLCNKHMTDCVILNGSSHLTKHKQAGITLLIEKMITLYIKKIGKINQNSSEGSPASGVQ
jgi:hypothetical protein